MNLILLGAPGAGKGTQAELIAKHLSIPSVSTGNLLRDAVRNGTPLGVAAKGYMDKGALVPDDVVIGMVRERIAQDDCKHGCIFDGFPRTVFQAEKLDEITMIDAVLSIEVPDAMIESRMSGRRSCPKCGGTYHIGSKKPQKPGVCDACGGELIRRQDDDPEVVRGRLAHYHAQTEPLIGYYEKQGKLKIVSGTGDISEIFAQIKAALSI